MANELKDHLDTWNKKPLLRKIYFDWYEMIAKNMVPGKSVELGSGSGNFKEFRRDVITTDIDPQPWLDMVFDAHKMPFKNGSISNLILIDVLHHLANPVSFLREASRVLKKGGRILMIEPFPTPMSRIIYRLVHPEPFAFDANYFELKKPATKLAWDANQAIPYLIFFKGKDVFAKKFGTKYKMITRTKFSYVTYPLSGGFGQAQFYPTKAKPVLDFVEKLLEPFRDLLAFRCYIVLEKL